MSAPDAQPGRPTRNGPALDYLQAYQHEFGTQIDLARTALKAGDMATFVYHCEEIVILAEQVKEMAQGMATVSKVFLPQPGDLH